MVNYPQPISSQYPMPEASPSPTQSPMTVSALQAAMESQNPGQKFAFDSDLDLSALDGQDQMEIAKDITSNMYSKQEGVDMMETRRLLEDPTLAGASTSILDLQKDTIDAKASGMADSDILARIKEKYSQGDEAEQQALSVLEKLKKGDKLDFKEGLAMLFAAVIPAVAGMAIGGTRTGMAGLAAGGESMLKSLQDRTDRNLAIGELEYKTGMQRADRFRGEASALEKSVLADAQYQARRGQKIEDKLEYERQKKAEGLGAKDGGTKIYMTPMEAVNDQKAGILAINRIDDAIDFMDTKIAQDGKFPSVVKRKFSELEPNSPAREFAAKAKQIKVLAGNPMIRGALSDKDMEDLEQIINGGWLADYELTRRRLLDIRDTILMSTKTMNELLPDTNRSPMGEKIIVDLETRRPRAWGEEAQGSGSFSDRIKQAEANYNKGKGQ